MTPHSFQLAQQAHQRGQFQRAETLYHQALADNATHAESWQFLGLLYCQMGQVARGAETLQRAVDLQPNAVSLTNLGEAHHRAGNLAAALTALQQAIVTDPDFAQAHFNLGNVYKKQNQLETATEHYQNTVRLQPDHVQAWYNLGNTFIARGLFKSAVQALEAAIALRPDFSEAQMNLGTAYSELGDMQKAVNRYKNGIELQPTSPEVFINLGQALEKQGNLPEALRNYEKALALDPENHHHRLYVETLCPIIMPDHAAIDEYRRKLPANLSRFQGIATSREQATRANLSFPSIITYQGGEDLPLKQQWSALFQPLFPQEPPPASVKRSGKTIRVGFVVTHGHEGVFLKCMRGILNRLPAHGPFDVTVVCSQQGGVEILHEGITHPQISFLPLPSALDQAVTIVQAAGFDILYYWECGTDSLNYFLPFYRAAPIQCTSWGWPTTSGIHQMDYFLSCDLLETDRSDAYYSEKLIRFTRLPVYYHRPPLPETPRPRGAFGLGARDHLYLCTQNLRKVHPDMDRLLEDILNADPQGRVLFIQDAQPGVTDLLRKRFRQTIPDVANQIQFLPRLPEQDYLNVIMLADVILDTLHYSGGANTTYDALAAGIPIVTLPMRFHRGRYTAAAYQQMGVTDCITHSASDYVSLAVRLGTDSAFRTEITEKIQAQAGELFEDEQAIDELARFFTHVVGN